MLAAILILIFGFFFATVSSRITGLIGTSSNPISGMTIATLILTCLLFVALGWTGDMYSPIALCVGAIVCIAAANAGNTSQDLKTGYIVGATPLYQQIGLVIGVIASALVIGLTILYLHNNLGGIGSAEPRGAAGDADGDDHQGPAQPESAVGTGARRHLPLDRRSSCAASVRCRSRSDRICRSRRRHRFSPAAWCEPGSSARRAKPQESDLSAGTLFSSGLIAGGSIAGILFAVLVGTGTIGPFQSIGNAVPFLHSDGISGQIATAFLFLALAVIVARTAIRKVE